MQNGGRHRTSVLTLSDGAVVTPIGTPRAVEAQVVLPEELRQPSRRTRSPKWQPLMQSPAAIWRETPLPTEQCKVATPRDGESSNKECN